MVTFWTRILVAACLGASGLSAILLLQHAFDLGWGGRIALVVGLAAALAGLGRADTRFEPRAD